MIETLTATEEHEIYQALGAILEYGEPSVEWTEDATAVVDKIIRDRVVKALRAAAKTVDIKRNLHWRARVLQADGKSTPKDYGKHDAYQDAINLIEGLARAEESRP